VFVLPDQTDEDYEILPHEEIEELRRAVEKIKKDPLGEELEGKTLLEAVDELNDNIKKLIHIFTGAQEELIKEYSEASPAKMLKEISSQNSKIAEGILGLADMIKELKKPIPQMTMNKPQTTQRPQYPPQASQGMPMQRMPPQQAPSYPEPQTQKPIFNSEMRPGIEIRPTNMQRPMNLDNFPPPEEQLKKGLFSRKK